MNKLKTTLLVMTLNEITGMKAIMPKIDEAAAALSMALGASKTGLATSLEKEVVAPAQGQQPTTPPPTGIQPQPGAGVATRVMK